MTGCGLPGPPTDLAVAVSGGADSLALTILLNDWLRARGGRLLAITVDHGLRPESADEAALVAGWLADLGILHRLCRWHPEVGDKRQARARAARYRLLAEACQASGIDWLALAHHRDDQAETLLLRLAQGSGADGLAGMATVSERKSLKLLRPLLSLPKARLEATLMARGQPWVEDPSNRDRGDARVRLRDDLPRLAAHGLDTARLAALAEQFGKARSLMERQTQDLLTGAARLEPAGYLWLSREALVAASVEIGRRALAQCLVTVGGGEHLPRTARLMRLQVLVRDGLTRTVTLGGCLVIPKGRELLIVREAGRSLPLPLRPGRMAKWDGRFDLRVSAGTAAWSDGLEVAALGEAGWAMILKRLKKKDFMGLDLPHPVRMAQPAIWARPRGLPPGFNLKLLAVPLLDYYDNDLPPQLVEVCRFAPRRRLYERPFTVV